MTEGVVEVHWPECECSCCVEEFVLEVHWPECECTCCIEEGVVEVHWPECECSCCLVIHIQTNSEQTQLHHWN